MASKYTPLQTWLEQQAPTQIRLTITELEQNIGLEFPPFVHKYPWGNDRTHTLARAFMEAGYLVSQPEADKEVLVSVTTRSVAQNSWRAVAPKVAGERSRHQGQMYLALVLRRSKSTWRAGTNRIATVSRRKPWTSSFLRSTRKTPALRMFSLK